MERVFFEGYFLCRIIIHYMKNISLGILGTHWGLLWTSRYHIAVMFTGFQSPFVEPLGTILLWCLWRSRAFHWAHRKAVHNFVQNFVRNLINQPEIRLYLPFFDWFGTKQTSVWCKINRKMVNTIWYRVA